MIIEKPWGKEELLELNPYYVLKRIFMTKGHRCSLQFHKKKMETIYVISGHLKITSQNNNGLAVDKVLRPGESITISPGNIHRMAALENAVYLESSTPELEDVVRLSDDYKRNDSK